MLISDEYKQANRALHEAQPEYGNMAGHLGESIARLCQNNGIGSVLDYGCGKGTLAPVLKAIGLDVAEYDPAIPGKDGEPCKAGLVVCVDVMEHVEPNCVDDVLQHIAGLAKSLAYFMIDNGPANKTLPDGRNAHLTVKDQAWWRERLSKYFDIKVFERVDKFETPAGDLYHIPLGLTIAVGIPKTDAT
jgi:hypothetical protein